jgi:hypothetical protein
MRSHVIFVAAIVLTASPSAHASPQTEVGTFTVRETSVGIGTASKRSACAGCVASTGLAACAG